MQLFMCSSLFCQREVAARRALKKSSSSLIKSPRFVQYNTEFHAGKTFSWELIIKNVILREAKKLTLLFSLKMTGRFINYLAFSFTAIQISQ